MDLKDRVDRQKGSLDRFRQKWFPPAAVIGAFAAFAAAVFRVRPSPKVAPQSAEAAGSAGLVQLSAKAALPARTFDREYAVASVLCGAASAHPFRVFLSAIAVGPGDRIYAFGDGDIRIFDSAGNLVRSWKAPQDTTCLTIGPDNRTYIGAAGRVEIYRDGGNRIGGFTAGEPEKPAEITSIKMLKQEILVADAAARFIRRYDLGGKQTGLIGTKNKTGNFILPNRCLDFDVDLKGIIRATDTGRHLVTSWALDGSPVGSFGKFGMTNPEDFVGCCNPVNLAILPDGAVVTAEKMVARVKVYTPEGKLLAVIGPEHFHPNCTHIHLAADSKGRIYAADPVRREIKVFSMVAKVGEARN
jgi:hypothetical protein